MPQRGFPVVESLNSRPCFRGRALIALRCGGLLALLVLTGCEPGIFPSQGVVGKGNTTIMIDSLAIMLAIVVRQSSQLSLSRGGSGRPIRAPAIGLILSFPARSKWLPGLSR